MPRPWEWSPHPLVLAAVAVAAVAYTAALRRLGPQHGTGPGGPSVAPWQVVSFAAGLLAFGVSLSWPVSDLARHWSATAHVVQQLLLVLAVPPLVLLGLPRWLLALATRPPAVDAAVGRITHPLVGLVAFNLAVIVAWLPPVVDLQATSAPVDAAVHLVLLVAGFLMWLPALRVLPGGRKLGTAARIGYLFAQSVIFNFPALILIFAAHPLYHTYAQHARALGISPVADQQLAGATGKVVGVVVLLGAVGLVLSRAQRAEEAGLDPDPLLWDDVERELRRLERRPHPTDAG